MRNPGPRIAALTVAAVLAFVAGCKLLPVPPPGRTIEEKEGRHLLQVAEGCGCHGPNFAGWRAGKADTLPKSSPWGERFVGPFGVIPAPNITPDKDTGIGAWSDADIEQVLRAGVRRDGTFIHPLMPYPVYAGMTDADMTALIAYLRRLKPVRNPVPKRQLTADVPEPGNARPPAAARPTEPVALGGYLVNNVSGCADCHTPGSEPGREGPGLAFAGKIMEAGGQKVVASNITPDKETGVGSWSAADIARYLRTGRRPDGGLAQSLMAGLIVTSFSHYTPGEARAVAAYLKSLPPARHRPR